MRCVFVVIMFSITGILNAQYITSDGEVNKDLMISELQHLERGSEEQSALIKDMLSELVKARKNHPALRESSEKRGKVGLAIINLGNKQGDFFFLNPQYAAQRAIEREKENDTISLEVLLLETRLAFLQDSIREVYQELKTIVEDENQTRATKEKAITVFATSNELKDIEYIFENSENFVFPDFGLDHVLEDHYSGEARTGMHALYRDKIPEYGSRNEISLNHNWILFPFMVKYWGDQEWNKNFNEMDARLELVFALRMFLRYLNKPELLVEFMRANAKDPDTLIFKTID